MLPNGSELFDRARGQAFPFDICAESLLFLVETEDVESTLGTTQRNKIFVEALCKGLCTFAVVHLDQLGYDSAYAFGIAIRGWQYETFFLLGTFCSVLCEDSCAAKVNKYRPLDIAAYHVHGDSG